MWVVLYKTDEKGGYLLEKPINATATTEDTAPPCARQQHYMLLKTPLFSCLSLQRRHELPRVGVRVVALHGVQLVAVVPPSDGIDMSAQHANAVVGMLLLQRLDGAPGVVTGVVPEGKVGRQSVSMSYLIAWGQQTVRRLKPLLLQYTAFEKGVGAAHGKSEISPINSLCLCFHIHSRGISPPTARLGPKPAGVLVSSNKINKVV